MSFQMITDTWDETNAIIMFTTMTEQLGLINGLSVIWSQEIGNLYRPLPVSTGYIVHFFTKDAHLTWVSLRLINTALLLSALFFLVQSIRKIAGHDTLRDMLVVILFLGSGATIITAAWFANIFDASALFFVALGVYSLTHRQYILAFLSLTVSFYCKEISILAFPLVVILGWSSKTELKPTIILTTLLTVSFAWYFFLRQQAIPLGSPSDIHGFEIHLFLPTLQAWLESLWWQNTRREAGGIIGIAITLFFLASLRDVKVLLITLATLIASTIVYWGMFPYRPDIIIDSIAFQSRLYLLPMFILLFVGAVWGRHWSLPIIAIPMLLGGYSTYLISIQFQQSYQRIYSLAKENRNNETYIHYPQKPLKDNARRLFIGDYPKATYKIEPYSSKIISVKKPQIEHLKSKE